MTSEAFSLVRTSAPVSADERERLLATPSFGQAFTDHMATVRFSGGSWRDPRVEPRAPIAMDPAAAVLHYGQEIFEGLKAYRRSEDEALLFRPEYNARRLNSSAERLAMPALPEALFLGAIEALVRADLDWLPAVGRGSLYLRPFMIATEALLSIRPANEYLFAVIASPVGDYFGPASRAISVWVAQSHSRAGPDGTGAVKCGGNYAASLTALTEARAHGCDQVVFLDACERRYVEELGGMNLFFVFDDGAIVTPPLSGTILPGVTRDAVITLARARGFEVREEAYSLSDWRDDARSGRLKEVFACGTAAVVAGVGEVCCGSEKFKVGDATAGPVTLRLREDLTQIQVGAAADPYGWSHPIKR